MFVARIKSSMSEITFLYLVHGTCLLVSMMVFAVLGQVSQEYVSTLQKVQSASGLSIPLTIYCICPSALLLSLLCTLAYHSTFSPWKAIRDSGRGCVCPPLPRSEVTTEWMTVPVVAKSRTVEAEFRTILEIAGDLRQGAAGDRQ